MHLFGNIKDRETEDMFFDRKYFAIFVDSRLQVFIAQYSMLYTLFTSRIPHSLICGIGTGFFTRYYRRRTFPWLTLGELLGYCTTKPNGAWTMCLLLHLIPLG